MRIIFDGIKHKGNVYYISFKNEIDISVEIPVPKYLADHIMPYIQKIAPPTPELVEKGNVEPD